MAGLPVYHDRHAAVVNRTGSRDGAKKPLALDLRGFRLSKRVGGNGASGEASRLAVAALMAFAYTPAAEPENSAAAAIFGKLRRATKPVSNTMRTEGRQSLEHFSSVQLMPVARMR